MPGRLVEMVVESVRVHMPSNRHVVILKESERDRYLPIWIGPWEASAIASRLQGHAPERPQTHDLFATTLDELDVRIEQVVIAELADETYHARLHLRSGDRELAIDARPSDALALAVRASAPIFAAESVLDQAGLGVEGEESEGDRGSPLERTGEPVSEEQLEVFRDFINSLDLDLEGGEGGGASR
jgi:bifunctional DNase/RNase